MKIPKYVFYTYVIIFVGLISLLPVSVVYADDTSIADDTNTAETTTTDDDTRPIDNLQTPVALSDNNASATFASTNLMQAPMAAYALSTTRGPFTDPGFTSFKNDNPPALKSPTYVERPLGNNSTTTYTLSDGVQLSPGSTVSDTNIYISNMTDAELRALKVSDFTFAANSPLQAKDVTVSYNSSQKKINFIFTPTSAMKTNGAGTQAIMVAHSGTKTAQFTIGIYRNYVTGPVGSIKLNDQYDLCYMINNLKEEVSGVAPTTVLPNFYLLDKTTNKKIYAFYSGTNITNYAYYTNLYGGIINTVAAKQEWRMDSKDHVLIEKDPNDPNRLLAQYDAYPNNNAYRYRMFLVLEPSATGDAINVRRRAINYNPNGSTQKIWFYQKYNTALDGKSDVPIYYGAQIQSGADAGKPRGLYISNYQKYPNSPYRMTFDMSGSSGPTGFAGAIRSADPYDSPTDPSQFTLGHAPDSVSASQTDTGISMLWSPAKVGSMGYGKPSNEFGFNVSYDYALAPALRVDQTTVNYNPGSATTLPALNLSGQVQDYDSSRVKVFYTVDTPVTPTTATQNSARQLSTVSLSAADNNNPNWVKFPGSQATPTAAAITNQADLQKLADGSAHTIYLYAFDNGSSSKPANLVSNIETVTVPALSSVTIQYQDTNWTPLQDNKVIRGAIGDRYDTGDETYFPRRLLKDGTQYTLNSIPSAATGVISGNQIITLTYTKLEGTLSVTAPSILDFGKHQLMAGTNTATIEKQDQPVVVTDTTGAPIWSLYMKATPFTQVGGSQTMPNVLKYRQSDTSLLDITTDPQKILSYSDVNSPITNNTSTTNLDDYWWQTVDDDKHQVSGPIIQGDRDQLKSGKYQSTITWTLQNSLN